MKNITGTESDRGAEQTFETLVSGEHLLPIFTTDAPAEPRMYRLAEPFDSEVNNFAGISSTSAVTRTREQQPSCRS